uniref:Uncharacterized protein n=1 Tax=Parascaris univalens TaxID=6257 RepID=A0A914ZNG8_PARUN
MVSNEGVPLFNLQPAVIESSIGKMKWLMNCLIVFSVDSVAGGMPLLGTTSVMVLSLQDVNLLSQLGILSLCEVLFNKLIPRLGGFLCIPTSVTVVRSLLF